MSKFCGTCNKSRPHWAYRSDNDQCIYCERRDEMKPRGQNVGNSGSEVGAGTSSTANRPLSMDTVKECEACGQLVRLKNMRKHFESRHNEFVEERDA